MILRRNNYGVEEIWKPIKNYEERYWVSNMGRIKNKRGKFLKFRESKDGYFYVSLWNGTSYKYRMVHCLVAEAFLIKNSDNLEVDHIDNNRKNNIITNLQYITHKENLEKSFALGHQKNPKRRVLQYDGDTFICAYESIAEAYRKTGILHISEVASGKRKTAGGFKWIYDNNKEE